MKYKNGYIYIHTNKITGKRYVGQSTQPPERRFRKNDKSYQTYSNCTVFFNALNKYGWDNFTSEIICFALDPEHLNSLEEHFIREFNALVPNGYNSVNVIDNTIIFTPEIKAKISAKQKAHFAKRRAAGEEIVAPNRKEHKIIDNQEHKECGQCNTWKPLDSFGYNSRTWDKLHLYCKPCWNAWSQKHRNTKTLSESEWQESYEKRRQAIAKGLRQKIATDPSYKAQMGKKNKKPIQGRHIQTGKIIQFDSASDAKVHGFSNTNIGRAIKNKRPYMDYMWSFVSKDITRIYARNCEIRTLDINTERSFLIEHHRQKYVASTFCYGLYYQNQLVCLMSFGKPRFNQEFEWELLRLCTKSDCRVIGGASKLLTYFIRQQQPNTILSYAAKEYSDGGVYKALNFELLKETPMSYYYEKDGEQLSRYQCQKHKLSTLLTSFDPNKTEKENMLANGYTKVVTPGQLVYLWYNKK